MKKLLAFWDLLNAGRQVANPEFWKKAQAVGQPVVAALLVTIIELLKGTEYEIQMDDATIALIAGGIFAVVNWVLTHITTTKDISILPSGGTAVPTLEQATDTEAVSLPPVDATVDEPAKPKESDQPNFNDIPGHLP
jgi:hypothetical protein